eukprot:NODE_1841_length_1361_cov_56.915721_g1749_i0.p1 GENE.NODE_1841_length_1361_cov_56.915721_g1749_i0~~NODE_1841_length_1361_cov_56.915721_g1749_i0.p1  ORF type:complete len:415 (-),score=93.85 NODE_1841_length_1361_cov_56.915721_g1749_i0:115-1338(-)
MAFFQDVPQATPDAIFELSRQCRADPDPNTMDLGIGAYRDEHGKPYLLQVVSKVEQELAAAKLEKEYLPIDGLASFREESVKLLLGPDSKAIAEKRVASCQGLSGTGCLRVAAEFYKTFLGTSTPVYLSDPTWGNHKPIFSIIGFTDVRQYRYFDAQTKGVDFEGMCADLKAAPDGSIIMIQLCAHNPTGADPSKEQWAELSHLLKAKRHVVMVDSAYQGYATGDVDGDAYAARLFEANGLEFAASQSYAKNMGLYGERVGCLSFVCATPEIASNISSQLKVIVRPMYSNPTKHGARIAHRILSDPTLRAEWVAELAQMSNRIKTMRTMLVEALKAKGTPGDWSHICKQIGMFSYTGLTAEQCERLVGQHHIYLLKSGRISCAGLSANRIPYLANAIHDVVTNPSAL